MKLLTGDLLNLADILETMGADEDTILDIFLPNVVLPSENKLSPEEIADLKRRVQYKAMLKTFKQLSKSRDKVNELLSNITGKPKDNIDLIELFNEIKAAGGLSNFLSQGQQSQKEESK